MSNPFKATAVAAATAATLTLAGPLSPAAPLVAGAAHAQAGGVVSNRKAYRLQRAGTPGGRYCAFYKGRNEYDVFPLAKRISKRACFQTASACQSWFYRVQTAYPQARLRKPCRRAG